MQVLLLSNISVNNGRYYIMAATDTHPTIEELLEAVFSVRSVPRPYNEGQLPLEECPETARGRVGDWCEMAANLGVS
jgi:hypothetical protein